MIDLIKMFLRRSIPKIKRSWISTKPSEPLLELFTSPECSLCLHFKRQLDPYLKIHDLELREIDITKPENERYFELYKYDIPVLHVNGVFHQKHRFDFEQFETKLRKIGSDAK